MKRSGFTMLEVLIAVVIVALLLLALNTFIFSMGELWGRGSEAGRSGQAAIALQEVRPQNGATEQMLTFELSEGCRLINWPGHALPDVVCSLAVRDREGLLLLWHSKLEKNFTTDAPRETVITPLVTAMSYDYYDTDFKRWQTETTLRNDASGKPMVPQRLRFTFTYDKMTRETIVTLPNAAEGLPQF